MWGTHWKTFSSPLVRSLDGFPEATVGSCLATSHVHYPCIYHKKPSDRQMCFWGQFNRNAQIPHSTLLLHGSSLWYPLLSPRWDLAFIPPPQRNDNIPHKNTARLHNQVLRHPPSTHPQPHLCSLLTPRGWKMDHKTRTWYHTMQKQNPHPKGYKTLILYWILQN